MNVSKISGVVFSPTDTTKSIITTMAKNLPVLTSIVDITTHTQGNTQRQFACDELVIFGVPVYGGRVPTPAVEKIKNFHGNKTLAVIVATYGNRAYDDALLELKNIVEENGFIVVAAATFLTEHSIMHSVAQGRPDADDNKIICSFTERLWRKIQNANDITTLTINVPGNIPYVAYGGVPFKPQTTNNCTSCGVCATNCPVAAISAEEPSKTNTDICFSCMRCLKVCPSHARKLNEQMLAGAEQGFAQKYSARLEPEIFI